MSGESIVVGTDGSQTAERAVVKAAELGLALGATVHVVTSYSGYGPASWVAAAGGVAVAEVAVAEAREREAQAAARRARMILSGHGVLNVTHVCEGDPAQALMTVADGVGAEMIVVGNQRMTGTRRVWSVPNRVSHRARCSVLVVPT
jgi:nucleotide-binding universal stress UspA family protein